MIVANFEISPIRIITVRQSAGTTLLATSGQAFPYAGIIQIRFKGMISVRLYANGHPSLKIKIYSEMTKWELDVRKLEVGRLGGG
jgi:hypothetical protein